MRFAFTLGRMLMHVRPAPVAVLLKRLLRIRRQPLTTSEGIFWTDPASFPGQELARRGVYDPATLAVIKSLLHPGDTFVDVGANEGYFSVVASRLVGPSGCVIAVEPQGRLQTVLRRNFELNHCPDVDLVTAVVCDRPGAVELFLTPEMNTGASGLARNTRYRLKTQRVSCLTLNQLFDQRRISRPAVVKMDIEGWEHEVIMGSQELFRDGAIRALVLEFHEALITSRGQDSTIVPNFLAECGYKRIANSSGLGWDRHPTVDAVK